jgi:hypothetical protein
MAATDNWCRCHFISSKWRLFESLQLGWYGGYAGLQVECKVPRPAPAAFPGVAAVAVAPIVEAWRLRVFRLGWHDLRVTLLRYGEEPGRNPGAGVLPKYMELARRSAATGNSEILEMKCFNCSTNEIVQYKLCFHRRLEQVQVYLPACSCLTPAPNKWQQGDSGYKPNKFLLRKPDFVLHRYLNVES